MIYNDVDDQKCSSDAQDIFFKCFPIATLLQMIKPRGRPGSTRSKVDCMMRVSKAAWRLDLEYEKVKASWPH